jgi:hypothetical protein
MVDLTAIKQVAQVVSDEDGIAYVRIPLSLWEVLLNSLESERPQHERIRAMLNAWETEPDETPPGWWDEFDAFMVEQRISFQERETGLDDI